MSFQTQVEGLLSQTLDTTPGTAELTQFLVDGVKDVTNRIVQIRPDMASLFSNEATQTSATGTTVDSGIVLNVWRENGTASQLEGASEIDAASRYRATDPTSLFYRSKFNPGWYWDGNVATVVPAPSSSGDSATVKYVDYDETVAFGSTTIANFPDQYEHLVVLYATLQSLLAYLAGMDSELPADITLPSVPIAPSLSTITESLPTWTAPAGLVLPAAPADADVDLSSITSPSAFVAPTVSLDTALGGTDLTISSANPIAPSLSDSSITFSASTTYTAPVISFSSFPAITWSFPSLPVVPSISAASVTITGTAPTYTNPVLSLTSFPSLSWTLPSTPSLPVLVSNSIGSLGTAPAYTKPISVPDIAGIDTFIADDDPEMASAKRDKAGVQINQYQADIQNELNEFNKENILYQSTVQKAIQDAQLSSKDDDQALQKYSSEVQVYSSEVSAIVSANQGEITQWQQENAVNIQKYTSDIQGALNDFNEESAEYQALLQKDLQDAQLTDANEAKKIQVYSGEVQSYTAEVAKVVQGNQGEINEWQVESAILLQKYASELTNSVNEFNQTQVEYQGTLQKVLQEAQLVSNDDAQKIQKYGTEVQAYTADITKQIQEYTVNSINRDLAEWSANNANALAEYGSDIQKETSKYSSELGLYTQDIQKILQKYQAETGYDMAKYSAEVQAKVQDVANALQLETASHTSAINEYSADVSNVTQVNQSKLGKYSAESQNYAAETQGELANYNAKIQKLGAKYQWAQSRYVSLSQKYNEAFGLLAPPQQKGDK